MTSPGWYPDPSDHAKQIYWDGAAWSGPVHPAVVTSSAPANNSKSTAVAIGVCVLVAIGLVMSMQSVSLLSGSGPIWTGVGFVAAGTAVAFFLRAPDVGSRRRRPVLGACSVQRLLYGEAAIRQAQRNQSDLQ